MAKQAPDPPCCACCRNWTAPPPKGMYGDCAVLSVTAKRIRPVGPERGVIVATRDVGKDWDVVPLPRHPPLPPPYQGRTQRKTGRTLDRDLAFFLFRR